MPSQLREPRKAERPAVDRILHRNEHLFHEGEYATVAYVVVSGILKSYLVDEEGREQVIGFHMPGDTVGFEAVAACPAVSSVEALDTTGLRRVAANPGGGGDCGAGPDATVLHGMYREMLRLTRSLQMERLSLEERLARFLVDFSERQARRGCSRWELVLPMGRRDLARHLGIASETLSRLFSRFRQRRILDVENNHVVILEPESLRGAAGLAGHDAAVRPSGGGG